MVWTFGYILAQFVYFRGKIHTIQMKLVEIGWNFEFWKSVKTLILKDFKIYSNINLSNQVLRKLVKLASSQNVNSLLDSRVQTKTLCSLQGVFLYENWWYAISIAPATLVA